MADEPNPGQKTPPAPYPPNNELDEVVQRHQEENSAEALTKDKDKEESEQSNSNLDQLSRFSSCSETSSPSTSIFSIPFPTISSGLSEERNISNFHIVNSSSRNFDSEEESENWSSSGGESGESTLSGSGDTDLEAEEFLSLELVRVNSVLEEGGTELVLFEVVPDPSLTEGDDQVQITFSNNEEGSGGGGGGHRRTPSLKRVKEIPTQGNFNKATSTTFTPGQKQRLKKLRKKMFRKLNCGRCADAVRGCCDDNVPNDEHTNGVKILRKRDPPVDLDTELTSVTNRAVIARLKLILEKLDNGQLEAISPQVLKRNILYAVTAIQGEDPVLDRKNSTSQTNPRRSSSEETENNDTVCPIPILTVQPPTSQQEHQPELVLIPGSPTDNDSDTQLLVLDPGSTKRKDESDNELSEVDEEVIPEEVRKWLAATFTKSVVNKPRTEPRPRFRSVANAIRVGLFVDRFYRQLSSNALEIPAELQQLLKEINNWHFDIFKLQEKSNGHSLKFVAKELFSRYGLVSRFRVNLDKLDGFLTAVEQGYTKLKNPYHNDIHAADVTQTLHYFIGSAGIANNLTDLEIFALLFAALIHDLEHTGRTNNFHVNTQTDLALLYNDRSVLENHHVSAAFRLLKEDDKSMLANLKPEEFREFRSLVIEMVLFTDMSTHFNQIKHVRALLNGDKSSPSITMSLMSLLLHAADISHPGKPWRLHKKFADTILDEFFLQGDEEAKLGLPFSPLCDRNTVLIPESQISFIEFIVEPSLTILSDLIDFFLKPDEGHVSSGGGGSSGNPNNSNTASNSGSFKSAAGKLPPPTKPPLKPFQTSTSSNSNTTRRTESENNIKSETSTASSSSSSAVSPANKLPLTSRTPSFPLQGGTNHNYGPILRPWLNHLMENKAKWRMIAAERENAKSTSSPQAEEPPSTPPPPPATEEC